MASTTNTIHITKCGSVNRHIIIKIGMHINMYVTKTVVSRNRNVLFVEFHNSNDELQCISSFERMESVGVRLPADLTHISQQFNQLASRIFQQTVRRTHDELLSIIDMAWASTSDKTKLEVAGHNALIPDDSRKCFVVCRQ